MANFGQFSLYDLMYKLDYDQLVYWYEMANWKEHKIEPSLENYEKFGNDKVTQEDFDSMFKHDPIKGWVPKNG